MAKMQHLARHLRSALMAIGESGSQWLAAGGNGVFLKAASK